MLTLATRKLSGGYAGVVAYSHLLQNIFGVDTRPRRVYHTHDLRCYSMPVLYGSDTT